MSNNKSKEPSPCSQDGQLEFFVSEKSPLKICLLKKHLPPFLIEANAAIGAGRPQQALQLLNDQNVKDATRIVEDDPSRIDIMFMFATIFTRLRQLDKAEFWHKKFLEKELHPLVLFGLAGVCRSAGRLSEAIQHQKKAVELFPDSPELLSALAEFMMHSGQTEQAIDLLQKSVEKQDVDPIVHSKFLWHMHQLPDVSRDMLFDEHKRWAGIHAPLSLVRTSHENTPDLDRKLRVGYISPDFRMHSVAYFFESLLDGHNRSEVEVYGYGNVDIPDQLTMHLQQKFDHYQNIFGTDDKTVADMIEQDRIDILVDLAGHTGGYRLLVLAHKPAPVQVTYLGYPDTTGMQQVDYRLTDSLVDSSQSQQYHSEELVFLPNGFLCYKPPGLEIPIASLPAAEKGFITFGSFNNNCKINPYIMALWAQILTANSNWRLLLKFAAGNDQKVKDNYLQNFEQLGVSRDRVEIHGKKPFIEHLRLYNQVDIALDTYPYNGTTTTCEALWMGVPTISLVGEHHASRVGLSILSRVGLEFFAASSPDEYIAKATSLARKPEALAAIRASMRQRMAAGPLCNAKAFARDLETAYRKMWYKWCQSANADSASEKLQLKT